MSWTSICVCSRCVSTNHSVWLTRVSYTCKGFAWSVDTDQPRGFQMQPRHNEVFWERILSGLCGELSCCSCSSFALQLHSEAPLIRLSRSLQPPRPETTVHCQNSPVHSLFVFFEVTFVFFVRIRNFKLCSVAWLNGDKPDVWQGQQIPVWWKWKRGDKKRAARHTQKECRVAKAEMSDRPPTYTFVGLPREENVLWSMWFLHLQTQAPSFVIMDTYWLCLRTPWTDSVPATRNSTFFAQSASHCYGSCTCGD